MQYCNQALVNNNGELIIAGFDKQFVKLNPIPPRFQWNANSGYCGETCMISAGLYYGQYLSQYDVRKLVSGDTQQNQLLLGKNDDAAAEALRLNYERKITNNSEDFIQWIKQQVAAGCVVIIGVLNNEYRLGESTDPAAGDNEYDHIVPLIGWGADDPFTAGGFNAADKILLSDNGLYTPDNSTPYYYAYHIGHFFADRVKANDPNGNMYSLLELPAYQTPAGKTQKNNYAIAIKNVMGQVLPVRITTDLNFEMPAMADGSNDRPAAMDLTLSVTVSGLTPNTKYNLYYYTDEKDVPVSDFNKNSKPGSLYQTISIPSGTSFTTVLKIKSNEKAFFRAVPA